MKKATIINRSLFYTFLPGIILSIMSYNLTAQKSVKSEFQSDSTSVKTYHVYGGGSRDTDYILDDGSNEFCVRYYNGASNTGDFMWLNAFQTVPGAEIIDQVSLAFGANIPEGYPTRVILFNDPNNDGNPDDAQYLNETIVYAQDPNFTDKLLTVPFPPTLVDNIFFIAGLHQYQENYQYPAPGDWSVPQNASWVVGTGTGGGFNVTDLSDAVHDLPVQHISPYSYDGNWLLRAHGTSGVPPVCILDLDLYKNAGKAMSVTLDDLMVDYHYYTYFPFGLVKYYEAVFVCLGTYDYNHVLSIDEGQELKDYLDLGGNLYMEGGDTWFWDPNNGNATPVHSYFNIDGVNDGDDDTGPVAGVTGTFTDGIYFNYIGENHFMDQITATPATTGINIWENQAPAYINGVSNDAGPYKTIGTSFEFCGIEDDLPPSTKNAIMANYLDFFNVLFTKTYTDPDHFLLSLSPGDQHSTLMRLTYLLATIATFDIFIRYMSGPSVSSSPEQVAATFFDDDSQIPNRSGIEVISLDKPAIGDGNRDGTYVIDDGTAEIGIGLTGDADFMWLNGFQTLPGATTIDALSASFHTAPPGYPVKLILYNDPDNDGNPDDAVYITETTVSVTNPGTNYFVSGSITPNTVSGVFFVAALFEFLEGGVDHPAAQDSNSYNYNASWIVAEDPGLFDKYNLSNNSALYISKINDWGFPGNFLLRAHTSDNGWLTVSPSTGVLAPYSNTNFNLNFDATGLTTGTYNARIEIVLDTPGDTLEVPVSLEIGTPDIYVEPTTISINPTHNDILPPPAPPSPGVNPDNSESYGQPNFYNLESNNSSTKKGYRDGRILIKFNSSVEVSQRHINTSDEHINMVLRDLNISGMDQLFKETGINKKEQQLAELHTIYQLKCPKKTNIEEAVRLLDALRNIDFAEPDYIGSYGYIPPDPLYTDQWGLNNTGQATPDGGSPVGLIGADMNMQKAWAMETGHASISVAILDQGVDLTHPEFTGRLLPGYDFANDDPDPSPIGDNAHGTACAGIVAAAQDGTGMVGIAFGASIIPILVGDAAPIVGAVAQGIVWSADQGADVMSLSLTFSNYSQTLDIAANYAHNIGSVIIAAAGNHNLDNRITPFYPAALPNVITVGALNPCNQRKQPSTCEGEGWGSNFGALDFLCPGVLIPTTDIMGKDGYTDGDYAPYFNGTSAAAPHAAGVAALVLSHNPILSPTAVRTILQSACVDIGAAGYDENSGFGRLDAYQAVLLSAGANSFDIYNRGMGALTINSVYDNKSWLIPVIPSPGSAVNGGMMPGAPGATWEELLNYNDFMLYSSQESRVSHGFPETKVYPIILKSPVQHIRGIDSKAFGYNSISTTLPEGFSTFNLNGPEHISPFGIDTQPDNVASGAWANGKWYCATYYTDSLIIVDTATGIYTRIGKLNKHIDGLAWDPVLETMYGTGIYNNGGVYESTLYSIDLTTATATQIGPVNINKVFIALTASNEGNLYTIDLWNQEFGVLNKSNGVYTYISHIPFSAQYAQDMATDREDNRIYYAAYNNNAGAGQLWMIDHYTGEFYYIGTFEDGVGVRGFAIPTSMGRKIQPGESLTVDVFVDWDKLLTPPVRETGTVTVLSNDPDEPTVNVTVNVYTEAIQSSDVLENDTVHSPDEACFEGQYVIIAGGDGKTFVVESGADAYLVAGRKIFLRPGVHAQLGSHLLAIITNTGQYCSIVLPSPIVAVEEFDEEIIIETVQSSYLNIFPNPTTGRINVEVITSDNINPVYLEIFDFTGKLMSEYILNRKHQTELDMSGYENGIYVIKTTQGQQMEFEKVVKQ